MAGHARDTPPQPGANTAALNRAWTHGLGFNPSRKVKTTQSTTHTHTAHAQRCRKATQLHALPICSFSTAAQDRMGVVQVHPTAMTVLFGWLWVLVFGGGALQQTRPHLMFSPTKHQHPQAAQTPGLSWLWAFPPPHPASRSAACKQDWTDNRAENLARTPHSREAAHCPMPCTLTQLLTCSPAPAHPHEHACPCSLFSHVT